MRRLGIVIVSSAAALAYACGSSSSAKKDGAIDTPRGSDAHVDAPHDGPPGTFTLTIKNYLVWCDVKIGSGAFITGNATASVPPGTVTVTARATSGTFELGSDMWHDVDGDTGSGIAGTHTGSGSAAISTAMVTVGSAAKCAWVCCPFSADGTGCSGLADQCP